MMLALDEGYNDLDIIFGYYHVVLTLFSRCSLRCTSRAVWCGVLYLLTMLIGL